MKLSQEVYNQIISTIGNLSPEKGGLLGSADKETITHYYFDVNGKSTEYSYTPNIQELNAILEEWSEEKIYLVGIIHSHNPDFKLPSCMDIEYAERILKSLPSINEFYLPILICDEQLSLLTYKICIGDNGELIKEQVQLEII